MKKISPIRRSKKQARRYYDRISAIYDWLTASEKAFTQRGVDLLGISPGEKIVEIGCGTGFGLVSIQQNLSGEGKAVGLDMSNQMLLESTKKTYLLGIRPYLVQGDGAKAPLAADQFDGLLCSFTLELFPENEISLVLNEFRRILKPNGRAIIISLAQEPHTFAVDLYEWVHKLFPVAVDCRPIPLLALLQNQGFEIVISETKQYWGLAVKIALCQPK